MNVLAEKVLPSLILVISIMLILDGDDMYSQGTYIHYILMKSCLGLIRFSFVFS